MKLTSTAEPLERRESQLSQPSESDEQASEFDVDAVVIPATKTQEEKDLAKPRLRGRVFKEYPPMPKGGELSGLCSIM